MPQLPRPSDEARARFATLVPEGEGIIVKPMFGNVGAFVNGNMFMGLFGDDIGVKLPNDGRQKLLREPGAKPFGPSERPMGDYVTLPAAWTPRKAKRWIEMALDHVSALPPKAARARGARKVSKKPNPRTA